MAYLNKVMLIGNLGKDPEIRMTATGRKKVSFSLATSKRYRDAAGEQKEITDWHNVVGWGKTADIFEQLNVRKGTSLFVEGSISYRSWDDQSTGQKKYITEINLDVFQLLSKADNTISQGREYSASTYATQTVEADLNDLPF